MAFNIIRQSFMIPSVVRCINRKVKSPASCSILINRLYSAEPLAAPSADDEAKQYSPKITKLVDEISNLSLLEVADLNDLLKSTLKITDAPMMMGGPAVSASPVQEEVEEEKPVSKLVTVKLMSFDTGKKVALIKAIKAQVSGMNLVQAKKFVESSPQIVQRDLSKEDADTLKGVLETAGGTISFE